MMKCIYIQYGASRASIYMSIASKALAYLKGKNLCVA